VGKSAILIHLQREKNNNNLGGGKKKRRGKEGTNLGPKTKRKNSFGQGDAIRLLKGGLCPTWERASETRSLPIKENILLAQGEG